MQAHLTGYFLTYRCVYLLDSACKGCSLQFFKFVVLFSPIMFLKSDLLYFVLVAKAYGFCLRARPVNSDHISNVLETVKFVFCLQIHALAECTMNSKFFVHCTFSSCVYLSTKHSQQSLTLNYRPNRPYQSKKSDFR